MWIPASSRASRMAAALTSSLPSMCPAITLYFPSSYPRIEAPQQQHFAVAVHQEDVCFRNQSEFFRHGSLLGTSPPGRSEAGR